MSLKKLLCFSSCVIFCLSMFTADALSQERERVIPERPIQQTETQITNTSKNNSRPTLTNKIVVQNLPQLVKKTSSSQPTVPVPNYSASKGYAGYGAVLKSRMLSSIQSKLGIPYLYGSSGPNRYDCSGFIWKVFQEAGIDFERTSARSFWTEFEPVMGEDRYKFGTLVFFNGLGHIGIVVDENGFYQASSSKGITYSRFEGYWEKRIVGFRRVPIEKYLYANEQPNDSIK